MSSSIEYNYDFNYSLNLERGTFKLIPTNQEKDFVTSAHQLYQYQIINSKDMQKFYMLLIKQKPFIKLGKQIQELVEIQFELVSKKNFKDMDQQYFLRGNQCHVGRQREYYLNVIILFLMIILLRVIYKKHQVQMERSILFHFIHWELKGQHSTNHFYQNLLNDILKEEMIPRYEMRKPIHQQLSINQSLTFKQIQSSINLKRSTSNGSFALAFNKQNQSVNHNFIPSFNAFKKIPSSQPSTAQLYQMRPKTFQSIIGK